MSICHVAKGICQTAKSICQVKFMSVNFKVIVKFKSISADKTEI